MREYINSSASSLFMKVGVYGSAAENAPSHISELAGQVGKEIARRGHTVVTGGCPGLPQQAVLGAYSEGGKCVAYSPAINFNDHVNRFDFPTVGFTDWVFIPRSYKHKGDELICLKYRNVSSVAAVDLGIIVGGRTGTMNEFTLLYDWGKDIGVLEGSGGITGRAIPILLEDIDKDRGSKIIFDGNPVSLVDRLVVIPRFL